jgi:hypothetical protein
MKCTNCGLPLSPTRTTMNCPRCGVPLNSMPGMPQQQAEQAGWGNAGNAPQQSFWGQATTASPPFNPQGQSGPQGQPPPFSTRPPYPPKRNKQGSGLGFLVAGLCVLLGATLLVAIYVVAKGSAHSGNTAQTSTTTANNTQTQVTASQAQATPTATPIASPSAIPTTTTAYPGQQYIDGAQMAMGVDQSTMQPQQPTTSFPLNSTMYVIFNLHPPTQGGAVCTAWFLNGDSTPVTTYAFPVSGTLQASYADAQYQTPGQAYVDLYWANDKSCSGQLLAQQIKFTVTD